MQIYPPLSYIRSSHLILDRIARSFVQSAFSKLRGKLSLLQYGYNWLVAVVIPAIDAGVKFLVWSVLLALCSCGGLYSDGADGDLNAEVLAAIQTMPRGGGYDASDRTKNLLPKACSLREGALLIEAEKARPSFCSSATYLVFLKAYANRVDAKTAQALLPVIDQQDGQGIFGRWNANGPGCAKLVADLGAGINMTDWSKARPGDFLKIWWSDEIGGREKGHHVVYLGHDERSVRFWSSNELGGYGEKTVARVRCRRVLFTRITNTEKLQGVVNLPATDEWLRRMLREDFSWQEVLARCRVY